MKKLLKIKKLERQLEKESNPIKVDRLSERLFCLLADKEIEDILNEELDSVHKR
ncbi:MAG: hypothetical protein ABSG25_04150 [Bryobacteraceae bacterium]